METIWWNSHSCNLQNKKWENVETNFICFPLNRRNFRSEIYHSTSVPSCVTSLEVRCLRKIKWHDAKMSLYSDPPGRHNTLFCERVQDTSAQVIIQGSKRENWYTHFGSFQSWEGCWNSEIAQSRACSTSSMHWYDIPINTRLWDRARFMLKTKALSCSSKITQI